MDKLEKIKSYKMPISISRYVIRNFRLLIENYAIYKEQLDKLFDQYGRKDSKGVLEYGENNLPLIAPKYIEEFNVELNELLALEINIPFETFSESLLDAWDDNKYDVLTADELEVLYIMTISDKEDANVQSNNNT